MKKIVAAITLLLACTFANAQFIKLGAKGGANLVKLSGQSFNDQFETGYYAGGFVELKLGSNLFLQPEVLFNENNYRRSNNFASLYNNLLKPDTLNNIKLSYLSIPVLLGYKLANVLALQGGVQYGIKLNEHQTVLQNGKEAFKTGDFSLLAGVQLQLSKFRVTGRYAIGLNSINDIDNRDDWKSQSIQLGVGFVF